MRTTSSRFTLWLALVCIASVAGGQDALPKVSFPLDSAAGYDAVNVKPEFVAYRGRRVVKLLDSTETSKTGGGMAILKGSDFKDGTIEVELAGMPRKGAPPDVRGPSV